VLSFRLQTLTACPFIQVLGMTPQEVADLPRGTVQAMSGRTVVVLSDPSIVWISEICGRPAITVVVC